MLQPLITKIVRNTNEWMNNQKENPAELALWDSLKS
jgi:hypothetical protein